MGYCGIQVGLTGTFAFLLGYGLDLYPMFLPDGTTGIGKFGLMDYGSNNGRGVIPAAPTPWTRFKIAEKYSDSDSLVTTISHPGIYTLSPRDSVDMIYKINISDSEYYLIENINNNIVDEFDLDFLQFLYGGSCGENIDPNNINSDNISTINECIKNSTSTDRFDYFNLLDTLDVFNIENSVLTSVNNYDYGLPGSGLLIWHIDEDRIYNNLYCENINCDLENRGVQLEEADGAIDIGYNSSHPLFDDHINGWKYDFWYPGNDYYFDYGNPNISNNDTLFFNDNSIPNTKSNLGSSSLVSIEIISENEGNISFQVSFDNLYESIFLSDSSIEIIGSGNINDTGNIFYIQNDIVYKHNNLEKVVLEEDGFEKKVLVYNNDYHFVDIVEDSLIYWDPNTELLTTQIPFLGGYYESLNSLTFLEPVYSDISLGDLDLDGLDELVFTLSDSSLVVQNFNETYVNGFPIKGNFHGTPIIANIINIEDNKPEIISREGNHITILSSTGQRMLELSSFDTSQDIRIIPYWKDNKAALVDGQRLIFIDYDSQYSYWLNKYSNSYDYPITLNQNNSSSEFRTNYQSAYNYPNPITRGYTTFRFYVQNETQVKINVYDINGFKVESFSTNGVSQNEYNEINWNNIKDLSPGLYYAEVIFESRESELIKLAIIR